MSNLSGANIGLNFKGLLNLGSTINTPLSTTLQAVTDGDGVASPLFLSTNEVAVRGTTNAQRLIIDANAGVGKLLSFRSGNLQRWAIRVDGTESGANAGADIAIRRYDDAGTFIDAPITLARSSGFITLGKRTSFTGSTGTSLLNFPDAGTTAADGISFGANASIYRSDANSSITHNTTSAGSHSFRVGASLRFQIGNDLIDAARPIVLSAPTLTGSSATSALSIAQTWNTTGNPRGFLINFTNTVSGATARPLEVQVDGSPLLFVGKTSSIGTTFGNDGTITLSNGNYRSYFSWASNRMIFRDGVTEILNMTLSGVAIGKNDQSNLASSILELQSTTKGFLPPRMTTAQRDAIASPATGLMIYNTTTNRPNFFDGTSWVAL